MQCVLTQIHLHARRIRTQVYDVDTYMCSHPGRLSLAQIPHPLFRFGSRICEPHPSFPSNEPSHAPIIYVYIHIYIYSDRHGCRLICFKVGTCSARWLDSERQQTNQRKAERWRAFKGVIGGSADLASRAVQMWRLSSVSESQRESKCLAELFKGKEAYVIFARACVSRLTLSSPT